MANQRGLVPLAVIFLTLNSVLFSIQAISTTELFSHGGPDDSVLTGHDEFPSPEVQLSVPIHFFERSFNTIFVNINGVLTFSSGLTNYMSYPLPMSLPMIAPFYADIDTRSTGRVLYRETKDPSLLSRANNYINTVFSSGISFKSTSLFIVTWLNVGHFDRKNDKKNTFQVVIASNGVESYTIFFYPEGGITWLKGDGKDSRPDALAQIGFVDSSGRQFYPLEASGNSRALLLDRMSNIRERGVFVFRVGKAGVPGAIIEPDQFSSNWNGPTGPERCENTFRPCPPEAECNEYPDGFCCKCREGYIGNGQTCLKIENSPIRLAGRLSGTLNDQPIGSSDIYVYADINSGQIYTTIRGLQNIQLSDFQPLISIADLVGWLFAKRQPGTQNGFMLTGGVLNRTATIKFPQTGEQINLVEIYSGLDINEILQVSITLNGNLPAVPKGSKIELDDWTEAYSLNGPGRIFSQSSRSYRIAGNTIDFPFTIEQQIVFDVCRDFPSDQQVSLIKVSTRNHNVDVDTIKQTIRYNAEYQIASPIGENPCKNPEATCGPNSLCIVDGESFRCSCKPGFEANTESDPNSVRPLCLDKDECSAEWSYCPANSQCVNLPGTYRCTCNEGYKFDGTRCYSKESMCGEMVCDPKADCLPKSDGTKQCICQAGYHGNGAVCRSVLGDKSAVTSCPENLRCDPNARCEIDPRNNAYRCVCNMGYTGSGLICEIAIQSCFSDAQCGENGHCKPVYSDLTGSRRCICKPGFYGDGFTCAPKGGLVKENCFTSRICDANAHCVDLANGETNCVCNEGYTGDGRRCTILSDCKVDSDCPENGKCDPLSEYDDGSGKCSCVQGYAMVSGLCVSNDKAPCNVVRNCHSNATCKFNLDERLFKCECNKGFKGDGKVCESIQIPCNILNTCGRYADCLYSPLALGHRCTCRPGYDGDGYTCRPKLSCRDDPGQCHRDGECVFSTKTREYSCTCKTGFSGDGFECSPTNRYEGSYLFAVQGMSVFRQPTSPSREGELVLVLQDSLPIGLAYDCHKGSIYFTDIVDKTIYKVDFNKTHNDVIEQGLESPEGIAIDWISRNVYWTDSLKRTIQVSRMNGSNLVKTLFSDNLVNPRGIALHPGLGKMYWTDWNRGSPKIEMANMDGTGRQILVTEGISLPNMLTIDYQTNELCWTDAGIKRIECIDLYGTKRRLVHYTSGTPFDLAIVDDYIFWTDWETNKIHRVSRTGGKEETLSVPKGSNGRLHGIVAMAEACPAMGNQCRARNGGCKYLCLPNGVRTRTCACPDEEPDSTEVCDPFVSTGSSNFVPPNTNEQPVI